MATPLSPSAAAAASESAHLHFIKHRGEQEYPKQVWYLTLSALAVATLVNLSSIAWAFYRVHVRGRDSSTTTAPQTRRFSIWNIPAAILTGMRIVALRWNIRLGRTYTMSLMEVFVTLIYLSALLIWEFVHTNNLDPDFWSNKAAHIAAAQLPLLPALSSKNNVIGWLTGIGHEKLIVLHRVAARCILVLIWVHLWGRFDIGFTGVDDIANFGWQQLGLTAGTTYTLAIVLSIRPIRQYSYEAFYFTHVVLVFVFILTAYLHASNPGFGYYVWPTWVVWGFDRLIRLARALILNVFYKPAHAEGTLSLVTPDSLRLTLTRRVPFGWRPGQHVFLAFPSVATVPFEAHPFTIANVSASGEQELAFFIRAREGLTQRLVERVAGAEKEGVKVPVLVDGPYGLPPNLAPYSTAIFVAGGTGVSYTLPLMLDLVKRAREGSSLTKRILFVWVVRNEEHIDWLSTSLADAQASASTTSSLSLDTQIFVTRKREADVATDDVPYSSQGRSTPPEKSAEAAELGGLTPVYRRPEVRELLHSELQTAEGPVSVDVSGPPLMIKDIRSALAKVGPAVLDVLRGGPTVHFHAENFTL
ncbi:hypothetical protein BV25DRAFT_1910436 [Artomyces pyxidatus]|uniref:Uncharacterized protein n=1 Tax=Artomyces pyxidatus TaxID=48021 RepID=A0ACB8TJW7_9AGAM|nr:hypothetical protein BV25DRAFT_1910436 [Artomyces pyxidatus]